LRVFLTLKKLVQIEWKFRVFCEVSSLIYILTRVNNRNSVQYHVRDEFNHLVYILTDTGGLAIDSGSGQSFLVLDAYNVVKVEMVRHLMRYGWNPIEGERVPYDLCFRVISAVNQTALPSMTFHFLGAELVVDSNF
jgi:hypothetical protein